MVGCMRRTPRDGGFILRRSARDGGFRVTGGGLRRVGVGCHDVGFIRAIESRPVYGQLHRSVDDKVARLVDQLCTECNTECERRLAAAARRRDGGGAALEAAEAEIKKLRSQMTECNTHALRQVAAVTSSLHHAPEEQVDFYEPLSYLSESTRTLVVEIIAYKLWQIENGYAPPWMHKLIRGKMEELEHSEPAEEAIDEKSALPQRRRQRSGDDDNTLDSSRMRELQEHLDRALERIDCFSKDADRMKEQLAESERSKTELQQLLDVSTNEISQKDQEVKAAQERLTDATHDAERAKAAMELQVQRSEEQLAEVTEQLARTAETSEAGHAEALALTAGRGAVEGQSARSIHTERVFSKDAAVLAGSRATADKAIACDFEQDSACSHHVGNSRSSQTKLNGDTVDDLKAENGRLKLMLEELRAKFCDMMKEGTKRGIAEVLDDITEKVGLKPLRVGSVFEKLYQDAMDRVGRLEKLRERYRSEKEGALADLVRECTRQSQALPLSVQKTLKECNLMGLLPDSLEACVTPTSPRGIERRSSLWPADDQPELKRKSVAPRLSSLWRAADDVMERGAEPLPQQVTPHRRGTLHSLAEARSLPSLPPTGRSSRPSLVVNGLDPGRRGRLRLCH
eukprot:TRINITY_DN31342_c0_g2_i1.p1 TRINITY_DN31342_c0_g2~~TRINITY_DN31342_c0_g2_i1.p1  ORF type:complete len:628 (-),score=106.44 TRINITY_DN31342_c0_g2_i1:186-2069(-)